MDDRAKAAEDSQWNNLEKQTGRSRAQWIALANAAGFAKHGELVAWLKSEHGIGHGYANLVAIRAREAAAGGAASEGDLLAAMFAGKKAGLKPRYDRLMALARKLGEDVEVAPRKTYVSLRRSKQFALVQPSTATRLDLGLNLKGMASQGRLEAAGGFNAMCTHRIRLERDADVDAEVGRWLKQAYDAA
ncbi:MAG: DUF4287 domain-containing protein [Luteimonas sp.]|nr:DUF4287 domain-containing protein [Luteimonas sp.]